MESDMKDRMEVQTARAALAERIEDAIEAEGFTSYKGFADKHGIGRSTLYELLRGRAKDRGVWVDPSMPTLKKLAWALNMPLHEVIYLAVPDAPGADEFAAQLHPPALRRVEVGIAGWCGAGPEQLDFIVDDVLWVDEKWAGRRDLTAFRVRGDSMAATNHPIHDGDIIIVDKGDKGASHQAVVAKLNTGGYVCKILKRDRFEEALVSANPVQTNGTPHYIPMENVDCLVGRVARVIHDM
jgi:repressor LexA